MIETALVSFFYFLFFFTSNITFVSFVCLYACICLFSFLFTPTTSSLVPRLSHFLSFILFLLLLSRLPDAFSSRSYFSTLLPSLSARCTCFLFYSPLVFLEQSVLLPILRFLSQITHYLKIFTWCLSFILLDAFPLVHLDLCQASLSSAEAIVEAGKSGHLSQ